jgi:serine/threonine protein kinase
LHVHAHLQEYCDLGTLRHYVVLRLGLPARLKLGEPEAMARLLQLLHDSATGLAALHDTKVVHGDLVSTRCSGSVKAFVTVQAG